MTTDNANKKEDDINEKKEVAFYQVSVTAWYNTALEHDKSLFTLSVGGIGLLMTLIRTVGVSSSETLILYIVAMSCFLVCAIVVLTIFKKNKIHLEQVINNHPEPISLNKLDSIAFYSFSIAVLFSTIIGISSAINSYTVKVTQMTKNNTQSIGQDLGIGTESFDGANHLRPQSTPESMEKSFSGAMALKPQQPSTTTPPQPAPENKPTNGN